MSGMVLAVSWTRMLCFSLFYFFSIFENDTTHSSHRVTLELLIILFVSKCDLPQQEQSIEYAWSSESSAPCSYLVIFGLSGLGNLKAARSVINTNCLYPLQALPFCLIQDDIDNLYRCPNLINCIGNKHKLAQYNFRKLN